MCILFLHLFSNPDDRYKMYPSPNSKNERIDRPTIPLGQRKHGDKTIYCGKDGEHGGTWLGLEASGRFAAVTNLRELPVIQGEESRGALVMSYLLGEDPAEFEGYLRHNQASKFNLVYGDLSRVHCFSSEMKNPVRVTVFPFVISNYGLETNKHCSKISHARSLFNQIISDANNLDEDQLNERLLGMMTDKTKAPEAVPTNTSVGPLIEKDVSSIFLERIHANVGLMQGDFATVSTSIIIVDATGKASFREISWISGYHRLESFTLQ